MSDESVFREVDEELRRERLRELWRRYQWWIISAAVGVVAIVALNEGWKAWQDSIASRISDQFYVALDHADKGEIAAAQDALGVTIAEGSAGYQLLARFKQASLLAEDGKPLEAVATYDAIASAQSNPRLRDLALLLAGYILVDDGDLQQVMARLSGLAVPENPLRNAAREAIGLAQYKSGDMAAARQTFALITDDPLSSGDIRSRVEIYRMQFDAMSEVALPPAPAEPLLPAAPADSPVGLPGQPAASEAPPAAVEPAAPTPQAPPPVQAPPTAVTTPPAPAPAPTTTTTPPAIPPATN